MTSGQIAENKIRMSLVIPKDLKAQLEQIAKDENRSVNNLIITILQNAVNNNER